MKSKRLLLLLLLALVAPWAANAQQALPYSYGFENNNLAEEGWTAQVTSSSSGINSQAAHEGSYGFQFNYSESNAYLVSPLLTGTDNGVALSFYYKEYSSSYGDEQFYVGYTTDETVTDPSAFTYGDITTASTSWQLYEASLPAGTKRVAIKYVYNDAFYLYLDDFTFEAPATCIKPTGLTVTLTPGDGTKATFSWTENGTATQWQLCLNGDETNLITATTNPYQLTGLTAETPYTAKVRAYCDATDQSAWSNEVTFTPTNAYQLTVNDGTNTNGYVPIYGYYVDAITKSQFIIPASNLADMAWGAINKMTFYASNASVNWGNAQFEVYMTETDETTLSELADYTTMTKVMNAASLSISGNQMVVEFDTPYQYMGGNLMIGFLQTVTGTYSSCTWYGVSAEGASMGGYDSSIYQQNFLPKTTFEYTPGEQPACMWPTNLSVSNVTARTADLNWTENGEARAWEVEVVSEYTRNADAIPFTLEGLEPETEYTVRVRSVCDTEVYSDWSTPVTFTTDALCHTPTNLYADEITAYTAHLSWEGLETETIYDLRYAVLPTSRRAANTVKLADIINLSSADQNANQQVSAAPNAQPNGTSGEQLRDGWDGWYYYDNGTYYTNVGYGSESTFFWATLFPANSWTDNILTKVALYENSYNENPITLYVCTGTTAPEDVLYYEEFEPEGNAGFHELTLANPVVIDPTQNLWIMFAEVGTYPACAASNTTGTTNATWYSGDGSNWYSASNYTWMIRAYVEAVDLDNLTWTEVPGIEAFEYDLSNLTPKTHYIAQVRTNCGTENGVTDWVSTVFTTDPTCLVPTDLAVVGLPTAHTVTLNWTENGDATTWDVEVVGSYTTTWTATEYPYTVVGLEPDTEYSFRVRARCSDTDFSEWSIHVTATTDIACYAPTSLAVADITVNSALVSWASDANSCDLRYAPNIENEGDSWLVYDDGVYATNIGSSAASTRTWAVMYPASMLDGNTMLSMLSIYENSNIESNITINIYQGGETAPETLLYTEVVVPMNAGFHNVPLTEPVTIDPTQNLWIALTATGPYVMPACAVNDANNRWICTDGVWQELTSELSDYGWMIRAYVGGALDWVNVTGLTEYQYALANLEPETEYIVQVRSNCEEEGYSWWTEATFTTLSDCIAPEALAAANVTATTADLSWTGYKDSYDVRYYAVENTFADLSADFEDGVIPTEIVNDATHAWIIVEDGEGGHYIQSSNAGVSSSTSAISMTATIGEGGGTIAFDALCMGEGSSTYWDHCDFVIDGETMFTHGADLQEWTSYSYDVEAGEHTFTWSYTKDSSVNPTGDYFAVDNLSVSNMITSVITWGPVVVEEVTSPYTITGLTPETEYFAQVKGHGCDDTNWSEVITFTTLEQTTVTQTIELTEGWNWVSLSIEAGDPVELLQMLEAALGDNAVQIQSFDDNTEFDGEEWFGGLDDIGISNAQMYMIEVVNDCTVELQGTPANPADYEIYIEPEQWTWIGYPCTVEQDIAAALADFEPEEGDQIQAGNIMTEFDGEEWFGDFETLVPGQGYMYYSNSDETKVLVIRASAKARRVIANAGPIQAKKMRTTDVDVNL